MNDIDREAIVAVLAGEATAGELQRVEEWRSASPGNDEEFRRLQRVWGAAGSMEATAPLVERISADEVIATARRREMPNDGEPPGPRDDGRREEREASSMAVWRRWISSAGGFGAAAALVVGLGLGAWIAQRSGDALFGPEAFVTGASEVGTVSLQDGTVVRLAPDSRLVFTGGEEVREVSLEGRAYFAVSEDPARPFRVGLPDGSVEVLGTRFDLRSRDGEVQVAVVEGAVRMEAHGQTVEVGANQVAQSGDGAALRLERVDDVYRVIDWLGRFLAFETTPVAQVAEELQRRFGTRIEILAPELEARTVTGWFTEESTSEMITGICRVVDAVCTVRDGVVYMDLPS